MNWWIDLFKHQFHSYIYVYLTLSCYVMTPLSKFSDPQDNVPFADFLYTNDNFFKTLHDSLTESGILVLQLGMSPDSFEPAEDFSKNHKRAYLIGALSRIGFESIHVYEEAHCGFSGMNELVVLFLLLAMDELSLYICFLYDLLTDHPETIIF